MDKNLDTTTFAVSLIIKAANSQKKLENGA